MRKTENFSYFGLGLGFDLNPEFGARGFVGQDVSLTGELCPGWIGSWIDHSPMTMKDRLQGTEGWLVGSWACSPGDHTCVLRTYHDLIVGRCSL